LPVGSYQLEVTLAGYYPLQRPVTISANGTLRESVELTRQTGSVLPGTGKAAAAPAAVAPRWLSWTLTGLAAGGAVATGVAWGVRNHHASRWNGSACLAPGRTRGEVCPGERDDGKRAEQLAYSSGVATLLLAAGATVGWTLLEAVPADAALSEASAPEAAVSVRCMLGPGLGLCSGAF
jgi:hypothetical protein